MAFDADFEFDSKEWDRILGLLKSKWKTIEGRKEFGDVISPVVYRDIISHFSKEEGPKGPWKEWSSMYAQHMQRIGKGSNKILQDTGRLRQTFLPSSFRAQSDGILFYNNAKVNGFPYAAAHDEGGKKLPQRRFMWLSQAGFNNMIDVIEKWLTEEK